MSVLVVHVILKSDELPDAYWNDINTHVDGHLVNMNSLFNPELGDQNIESSVQNTDNFGLTNDRTISLSQIRDEHTQEQMSRLLLRKMGRVSFTVG